MLRKLCLLLLVLLLLAKSSYSQNTFVKVDGLRFMLNDAPYYFLGTNFWYGMNLGIAGEGGDRGRLIRELDRLKSLGINNLRIMGSTEGPDTEPWRVVPSMQAAPGEYNEQVLKGLDFLLSEMKKRKMYAVICLNNFWAWSGGMGQYVSWANKTPIPYHPPEKGGTWMRYQRFTSAFYRNKVACKAFEDHLKFLITRVNTETGIAYKNDPTIMSWQLANEPRSFINARTFRRWIDKTAKYIKSLDANHLISLGSEGDTDTVFSGTNFKRDHQSTSIDYATIHIWIQNWSWFNPEKAESTFETALKKAKDYLNDHSEMAKELNKPMVLEEFGIARDMGGHGPGSHTQYRDRYFNEMFGELYQLAKNENGIAGCNFWSWAGEGRPASPGAFWKRGDDLIGDPPHESQGWYSVYDSDSSTLKIISQFAETFNELGKTGTRTKH